jgi:hypothetical protein
MDTNDDDWDYVTITFRVRDFRKPGVLARVRMAATARLREAGAQGRVKLVKFGQHTPDGPRATLTYRAERS